MQLWICQKNHHIAQIRDIYNHNQAQPGAYTASGKHPVTDKGFATQDQCTDSAEDCEFLQTLLYIYTHACGECARMEDYNDGIRRTCTTNYGFTHLNFV